MTPRADLAPDGSLSYRPRFPLDLGFALMGIKTVRRRAGVNWWTTQTPYGVATVAFRRADHTVRADGWGPGLDWAFTQLPTLLGADDTEADDFRTDHPVVASLVERYDSLRIGATGRWYEALATAALGQRVVTADAGASRSRLAAGYGEPVPVGPSAAFPTAEAMLRLTDHEFHQMGVERSRARVVRIAAKYASRLEQLDEIAAVDASAWLRRLPGVGPWTAALTTAAAGGDADAVPVGDLHIPRTVTHALSGEAGDDERMLELLAPFAGHRQRVVRLLKLSGAGPERHRPAPFRYEISRI